MLILIKQVFIGSLASITNASKFATCISLNNQQCKTRPTLINLNPNECNQGLHYYPFMVNSDRFNEWTL